MKNILWLNGRDVGTDFGFAVAKFPEWGAGFSVAGSSELLLGRSGELRLTGTAIINPRDFEIEGVFRASSLSVLRANVANFFQWVRPGEMYEIETILSPGRLLYGTFMVAEGLEYGSPQGLAKATTLGKLNFRLFSPIYYDRAPLPVLGEVNAKVAPALGNYASTPEVLLYHPAGCTNPSVSLYRANGSLIKTVTFTITLGIDDYVKLVGDEMSVFKILNGVETEDPTIAPYGDPFFVFDPADGDPVNGAFPYLVGTNCYVQINNRRLWTVPQ